MNDSDLKHGCIYQLTRDVVNPAVNKQGRNLRRTLMPKYEWASKMDVWPTGMKFRYSDSDPDQRLQHRTIANFNSLSSKITPDQTAKWSALVAALEPMPECFTTVMAALDTWNGRTALEHAGQMLEILFDLGKVSGEDLAAAYKQMQELWAKESL